MILAAFLPGNSTPNLVDGEFGYAVFKRHLGTAADSLKRPDFARLLKRQLRATPSSRIHSWSHRFKMRWTNATRLMTQMIQMESRWDRPNFLLIHRAMSTCLFAVNSYRVVVARFSWAHEIDEDPAGCNESKVLNGVVILGHTNTYTLTLQQMLRRVFSGIAASTRAKGYFLDWSSSLSEAARGANGAHLRVAPFYVNQALKEGKHGS